MNTPHIQTVIFLILGMTLTSPGLVQASRPDQNDESLGLIQVISPKASIKVSSVKDLTMQPGDTLPLFQENEKYFIALAKDSSGEPALAAFARKNFQNRASAWVTAQQTLVFAHESSARSGKLYLRKGENLPVLKENEKTYDVVISRFGNHHYMEISKKLSGIHYRPDSEVPPELLPKKTRVRKITLADLPPSKSPESPATSNSTAETSPQGVFDRSHSFLDSSIQKAASMLTKETPRASEIRAETQNKRNSQPVYYRPENAYPSEKQRAKSEFFRHFLEGIQDRSEAIHIALLIMIIIALFFARNQRDSSTRPIPSPSEEHQATAASAAPPPLAEETKTPAGKPPSFSGSLEVFNIKDLIRFLHNSSSTGVLNLEVEGLSDPARVFFNMGEVKYAAFESVEGKKAFIEIFGLQRGSFRFQLSQQIRTKENIHLETSDLIDEAARIAATRNQQKIINFGQAG